MASYVQLFLCGHQSTLWKEDAYLVPPLPLPALSLAMSIQITLRLHISSSLLPQEQLLQAYQMRVEIPCLPLFPHSHVVQHFQILTTDHSAPPKSFLFS